MRVRLITRETDRGSEESYAEQSPAGQRQKMEMKERQRLTGRSFLKRRNLTYACMNGGIKGKDHYEKETGLQSLSSLLGIYSWRGTMYLETGYMYMGFTIASPVMYIAWAIMLVGFCQYKGMIFRRTDDPRNSSGDMCLYEGLPAVKPYGRKHCA